MESVREPAVAGTFYPNDADTLSAMIDTYIGSGTRSATAPKAIIAPHAGYVYSGPIAGLAYAELAAAKDTVTRVVLLGPSHRVAFKGMAVPSTTSFRTPLGDIAIDAAGIQTIMPLPFVGFLDQAHAEEHSLEVQLPFLQKVLGEFSLIPIVVGDASKDEVSQVLDNLWGGPETLVVISSDLSHYESYDRATELDAMTANKIASLTPTLVGGEACGCRPINGLLHFLKLHHHQIEPVDIRNSGDTAGSKDRVVGYGAWRVVAGSKTTKGLKNMQADEWNLADRQSMLQLAREAIFSPLKGEKNFNVDLKLFNPKLGAERATFVTINLGGRLRGCIGSLVAHRPLIADIAHNAQAAAFKDPRFPPLTLDEYKKIDMHISVLSEPWEVAVESRADLVSKLEPGKHGLIIRQGGKQATYLPSVWDQLSDPNQFVTELRRKAGLAPDTWSSDTQVMFYTTEEFS